jgi:hypothetical protein
MKLFAKAWLLPHVRAWSSNPSLPMLPARPEPSSVRALDARGEASARVVPKYSKSLLRKRVDRSASARGAALPSNGSARW